MRTRFVSVRLSDQERQKLNELAKRWGCPRSDVLRWSFRAILTNNSLPERTCDAFHPATEPGSPSDNK